MTTTLEDGYFKETASEQNSTELYSETDFNEPVLMLSKFVLTITYLVIGTIGMLGNILVVCVILNYRKMLKSTTNLYIINQSLIDGLVAAMLILRSVIEYDDRYFDSISDDLLCKLWLASVPLWGLLVSSSYNLIVMSMEKYLAVVHSIWHKNNWSRSKATISLVSAWLIGLLYQGAFKIPTTHIKNGKCYVFQIWPSSIVRRAVGVLTVFVQYIIPFIILCFFYGRMVVVLKNRVRATTVPTIGTSNKEDNMARARRNVIKTLVFVSVFYVACWTSNQVYFLLFNLGLRLSLSSPLYHFGVITAFFNCCVNPFIYMAKYEQFQTGIRLLVHKLSKGRCGKISKPENGTYNSTSKIKPTVESTA